MEHRFYSTMSVVALIIVLVGFGNTYGQRLVSPTESVSTIIHIHGFIFATWILLFVAQTFLILKGKVRWHERLGNIGIILAAVMLISGFVTAIEAASKGHLGIPGVEFPTVGGFLFLNFASALIFTVLAFAGWFLRHQPSLHKRTMLMATVAGLAPPGISRLPFVEGNTPAIAALIMIFISIGPFYDWRAQGKPSKAYLYSLPLVCFILPPVVTTISNTDAWQTITNHLISIF